MKKLSLVVLLSFGILSGIFCQNFYDINTINNPQNYYLYKDDAGRFNPIPWDLNESFGAFTFHQTLGPFGTTQLQELSPFTNTEIVFNLQKGDDVTLNIYNSYGSVVQILVSTYLSAGDTYSWQADGLPKGLYFYSLNVGGQMDVKKMVIQ